MEDVIQRAIERSISHNEIVTLDWSEDLESELDNRCEDSANNTTYGLLEYWGNDEGEWRVHLRRR